MTTYDDIMYPLGLEPKPAKNQIRKKSRDAVDACCLESC